jgi:hypothetical protein
MVALPLSNRTIWKIALRATDFQEIEVPAGAEILCAREQFEQICVWFRCDPDAAKEKRAIAIVGTGHPAPADDGRYLGTASLSGGQLMFHVFERVGQP